MVVELGLEGSVAVTQRAIAVALDDHARHLPPADRSGLTTHRVVDDGRVTVRDRATSVAALRIIERGVASGISDRATDVAAHRVLVGPVQLLGGCCTA